MELYILLFLVGLIGGFLAGLIGIGGGVMYVLVLPYLLASMGFPSDDIVQLTIANSIFGTMFAALSGNIALWRREEFYPKEVLAIGFFGTIVSLSLLYFFVNTPAYQKSEFNVVVIVLMVLIAWRTLRQVSVIRIEGQEKKSGVFGFSIIGAISGAVAALSGLGGGTIIVPVLNTGFNMTMQKAKSISLGVIFITSLSLTLLNIFSETSFGANDYNSGYIVWPLALTLSLGVVIASPFGVSVARRMSGKTISYIFVAFVMVVIIDKLIQLI